MTAPSSDLLLLETPDLLAAFASASGALVRLDHRRQGWRLVDAQDGGLSFRLAVPRTGRRVSEVQGLRQSAPQVTVAPGRLSFRWAQVVDDEGVVLPITVELTAAVEDGFLVFTAAVDNRSDRTVETITWPQLHALRPQEAGGKLTHVNVGYDTNVHSAVPVQVGIHGYWGTLVPEHNGVWNRHLYAHLRSRDAGLYLGRHDVPFREAVMYSYAQHPGTLDSYSLLMSDETVDGRHGGVDLSLHHLSFVAPGRTHCTGAIALRPYVGGWMAAADCYRAWRATWFRDPLRPAWVEDVHSWLQIQIFGAEDQMTFRYRDLPAIAHECSEHGITAIQLTGWADGGQDRGNPSHDIEPALGTWQELHHAIAESQALGVKIVPFSKFTWWDQSRPDYDTEAQPYLARDPYGHVYPACGYTYYTVTHKADINTSRLIPTCSASPRWRKRACHEMRTIAELGADGTLYDECQHHHTSTYCFAADHGHPVPAYLYAHDAVFGAELRAAAQALVPEFLMAGELCTDAQMQEYHLTYTRFRSGHIPAYRYIAPHLPIMMAVDGLDDRNKINKCLEYRYIMSYEPRCFKGRPRDAPRTMAYGRRVDDLRRRHRILWDGLFRGPQGAAVTVDGGATDEWSHFQDAEGRQAVVVCNTDPAKTVSVSVAITGVALLLVVTPEHPEPRPCTMPVAVPPRSVVVVLTP